ncbi:hypothetical protein [Haloarcula onubensis]|uniref:Preprotein translocase subunit TatA n=1 Tax=Haloarcula onubensis TaxID=2950539 RepID=A0ABU2FLY8_9EURY|nr:hypothetical protein [Halomicroarcula sp. S3CR25-11]MDS0281242.1 hypothetical protein [Halomicroarcula sp. S3CR25-11]
MSLPLLFPGLPGGVELLVILLLMATLLVVPLVAAGYLLWKRRGRADSDDGQTAGGE